MNRVRAAVFPVLLWAAATWRCGGDMKPGSATTPGGSEASGETLVVQPGEAEIRLEPIRGSATVVHASVPPTGAFQTTPPASDDQVIRAFMDDVVVVSGARFTPA